MRPSNAVFLYVTRLRSRMVQELLALVGIAVGVGLVFAALVANTSLTGSVRQLTDSIVGDSTLQLAARGPRGFDERVLHEVRALDSVQTAAPIVEARANVLGPDGRASVLLAGGDPAFSRLGGSLLTHFRDPDIGAADGVALPTPLADSLGLAFGQRLMIEVGSRTVPAVLDVRLDEAEIGDLVHHPVALAPLATAQRIAGMDGRITRVFVEPERGRGAEARSGLTQLARGRLDVAPADAEVQVFAQAALPTNQSTTLFSVFSALVGFLFAFSAVLLTVPQRKRFIGDIRMAGHDSAAVAQLMLLDALVLGVAGSLLGLLLGDQLSRHLFEGTPGYLAAAFAVGSQRIVDWPSIAIACGAGVSAACVAVFVPLRDILAFRPGRRRRSSRDFADRFDVHAAIGALGCLLAVTVLVVAAPGAAIPAIATLTVALLLVLPCLLRAAAAAFGAATGSVHSIVPTLALRELGATDSKTRTLAVAATGAVAVFATVAIGGSHADLERGLDASARDIDRNADVWITFDGKANTLATTAFDESQATLAAVRRVPGVRRANRYRGSFLDVGDRRAWVLAPPPTAASPVPPTQVLDGADTASARLHAGGWVALSRAIADDRNVAVGDRVTLPTVVPTALRVAAITTNLGWPPGAIVLNADDYATAWGSRSPSALHVDLHPGADPERVVTRIRATLGPRTPMRVETVADRVDRHYELSREGLSRLTQISVMVLISAVLAMAVTMGGMIWQRRRSFAALKVQGISQRELWSALLLESGLVLGTACLAGAAFGLYGQVLLSRALEAITGFPVFYSFGAPIALGVLGLATLVAVAMIAVPGWLAVRVRPQPGIPT